VGGVLADAYSRRLILLISGAASGVSWAGVSLTAANGVSTVWLWAGSVLIAGFAGSAASAVEGASIRAIVDTDDLAQAGQDRQARAYLVTILGPAMGGGLLGVHTTAPFIAAAAGECACILLLVRLWRDPQMGPHEHGHVSAPSFAFGGILAICRDRVLLAYAAIMLSVGLGPAFLLEAVVYSMAHDGSPAWIISAFPTAFGIGGILGSVLLLPVFLKRVQAPVGRMTLGILCVETAIVAGIGLMSGWQPRTVLAVAFTAIAPLINPFVSFLIAYVPDDLQGRVLSTMTALNTTPNVLAPGLAAVAVGAWGGRGSMLATLMMALPALLILFIPVLRDIPDSAQWSAYMDSISQRHGAARRGPRPSAGA
jgi:Major Facilitator Superfamily.